MKVFVSSLSLALLSSTAVEANVSALRSQVAARLSTTGDAECAALSNYNDCRDHYYEFQSTSNGVFGCNWVWDEDTSTSSCLYDGDRDAPGGNPFDPSNVPEPNEWLLACLQDNSQCNKYTGTKTTGKNANDYATCYRTEWRAVSSCKSICNDLFGTNIDEYTWGYKVYDACNIGCDYAFKFVAWREKIALDNGLWNGDTVAQQEVRVREDQTPQIQTLPEYIAGIDDYECDRQCQSTVWHYSTPNNKRCNWNTGFDINVHEIYDFGAVASCKIGCLIGKDPSMGALPPNREDANAAAVSVLYP